MGFRDQIVLAAVEIGMEVGEEGLTMRGIAAKLNVSATALYQHFDGKAAIMRDIRFLGFARLWQAVEPELSVEDPRQRICQIFRIYFRFSQANPWLYSTMMRADPERWQDLDPVAPLRAQRTMRACEEAVSQMIQAGRIRAGIVPRRCVMQLWGAAHGMCSLLLPGATLDRNPFLPVGKIDEFVDEFIDAMVCGFVGSSGDSMMNPRNDGPLGHS